MLESLKNRGLVGNITYPSPEVQKSKAMAFELTKLPGMYILPTLYVHINNT